MKKKGASSNNNNNNMFELPPKCPALAGKLSGIFGWRHTYQVHQRQKGLAHASSSSSSGHHQHQHLYKSYSLNLPRKVSDGGEEGETSAGGAESASLGGEEAAAAGGAGGAGASSAGEGGSLLSPSIRGGRRLYHRHSAHQQHRRHQQQPAASSHCNPNPDSWVVVHHLQSASGILDPEDHISDVADDREELIASYEDAGVGPDPGVPQGGGDGASGSSVGTGSPDIFIQVPGGPKRKVAGGAGAANEAPPAAPRPEEEEEEDEDDEEEEDAAGERRRMASGGVVGGGGGPEGASKQEVVLLVGSSSNNGVDGATGSSAAAGGPAGGGGGPSSSSCIEVSANEPAPLGLGLQVRRGSEPSLHQIGVTDQRSPLYNVNGANGRAGQETSKRWSAAPVCRSDSDPPLSPPNGGAYHHHHHHHLLSPEWNVPEEDSGQGGTPPAAAGQTSILQQQQQHQLDGGGGLLPQAFNRSGRLSMQFLGVEATSGYRWMDAAEKAAAAAAAAHNHNLSSSSPVGYQPYLQYMQQHQGQQQLHHSFHHSGGRGGGGGGGGGGSFSSKSLPRESTRKEPLGQAKASVYDSLREKDSEMLLVMNESGGPLGLTAIPDKERGGLLVQSVEPGSRAERGRLRRGDRILEINNIKLVGLSEGSVQEHLRKSLASTELRLRVVRGERATGASSVSDRLVTGSSGGAARYRRDNRVGQLMIEAEEKPSASAAKVATVSPTRKMPGGPSTASSLQVANTRKLGKRIEITLTKGDHGLGFSVTTRDNPAGGHCPIYIKNILPKGAAVEDGRLRPGDRLLEVEGIPMTGKSQTEVVAILRGTPHGATLQLVVSRQQELASDTKEREIGFNGESEPKKPPPPVLPKSSLKQSSSSTSLGNNYHQQQLHHHYPDGADEGGSSSLPRGVSGSRSLQKLSSSTSPSPSASPRTPTVQKKPLASILKSASTNQVAELLQQDAGAARPTVNGGSSSAAVGDGGGSGAGSGSMANGGGSLSGAAWKNREILTLHIPVHDTEKAGLGVSVKGKTGSGSSGSAGHGNGTGSSSSNSRTDGDLGIFVKSVLHGGAASRDGRLKMNDQLLSVNGVSLLGQSNAEAMETLRRAMLQSGGSYPGKIILTVARRIGRPVSTGELLETIDPRSNTTAISSTIGSEQQQQASSAGTTVIYLSPDKQQQHNSGTVDHNKPQQQQQGNSSKRYSNPVLDRLTGGSGGGGGGDSNSTTMMGSSSDTLTAGAAAPPSGGHYSSHVASNAGSHLHHHQQQQQQQQQHNPHNQRGGGGGGGMPLRAIGGSGGTGSSRAVAATTTGSSSSSSPAVHGLRNESYYMATGDHWSTTSSATSLNGSNAAAVLIEEDPEPTSPTFHLARPSDGGGGGPAGSGGAVPNGNGHTSTPNGGADTTYASQLSLETNPPPSDAFSRDAIGRRSMSEKHHAAMDARETGTYQRNKRLREERERDSKLLLLVGGGPGPAGGSMESISHQMARIDSLRHGGAGRSGRQHPSAALAAHLLRDEAQDRLGELGPSLGMKKSSSLESLQTMVQEIQMADEPRGPNALRTPRGHGRNEILRALVEQPPPAENQAKKHWLLEDGPVSAGGGNSSGNGELPDGGFVSRNSPFQSSLNDGKGGAKLRVKKSGGLLRGIGHMFRFGKHRKDGVAPVAPTSASLLSNEPAVDYTTTAGGGVWITGSNNAASASAGGGGGGGGQKYGNNPPAATKGGGSSASGGGTGANGSGGTSNGVTSAASSVASAASRYIVFDPNSVERSASSGIVYGHHQPPHYQPPPPPPGTGAGGPTGTATSIHHTDVFNHRYSHYVNYEELQQQLSRRHHHYHSQRSARNTPPISDIAGLLASSQSNQQQPPSHHHHSASLHNQSLPLQQQPQQQQKYKNTRPTSSYYETLGGGGGYETISSIGAGHLSGGGSSSHRKGGSSTGTGGGSSISNTHTLLTTVSSASSSSTSNTMISKSAMNGSSGGGNSNMLLEEGRAGGAMGSADWHHHQPGGGVTNGSMRNARGPFVTQVKIQNQMSYQ